jgi:hypothetical protein
MNARDPIADRVMSVAAPDANPPGAPHSPPGSKLETAEQPEMPESAIASGRVDL